MSLYFNAIIEKRRLYHLYLNVEIEKKANPKSHPTKYRVCTSFHVNIEKKANTRNNCNQLTQSPL